MNIYIKENEGKTGVKKDFVNLKDAITTFNELSKEEESFMMIYGKNISNYVLEVSYDSKNKWKLDFPISNGNVHKQKFANKDEVINYIKDVFDGLSIEEDKSFLDVPVQHYSLDEMLAFKYEDEMLLRGEDPDMEHSNSSITEPKKEPAFAKQNKTTKLEPKLKTITKPTKTPDRAKRIEIKKTKSKYAFLDPVTPIRKKTPVKTNKSVEEKPTKKPITKTTAKTRFKTTDKTKKTPIKPTLYMGEKLDGKPKKSTKKIKKQTTLRMGETLNTKTPKSKKENEEKPKDDNSFFQI